MKRRIHDDNDFGQNVSHKVEARNWLSHGKCVGYAVTEKKKIRNYIYIYFFYGLNHLICIRSKGLPLGISSMF